MEVSKIPMNKKKMLSLFLTCCMLVGMIPAALAAELEDVTQTPPAEETQQVQETPETTEEETSVTPKMSDPEDLIPDDESVEEPSLFSETPADTTEATDVAEIDGTKYQDFATALAAAKNSATLKLLDDVTLDKGITIGQEDTPQLFTLDLNGHTATVKAQINICYASEMTIRDSGEAGKIDCSDSGSGKETKYGRIVIFGDQTYHDGAKPEETNAIKSTLVLESGIITSSSVQGTIGMFGNGATFHMTGGSVINTYKNESTDGAFAIAGNGTRKASEDDGGIKIIIEGGEVKSAQDCAIYLPCYNDTTISGGTIEGWSGIEIDSGNLTITGGTIKSTYESDGTRKYKESGDGNYNFGAALAIVSKGAGNESKTGYYGNMNIDISGGTLVGGKYYAVDEYNLPHVQSSSKENKGYFGEKGLTISGGIFSGGTDKGGVLSDTQKKFITGGTFSGDPSDYLADGYVAVKGKDTYTVEAFADIVSATLDVSKSGGITAEGSGKAFTLSGDVDMRKYTVTDTELVRLFSGLLADKRTTENEPVATANEATPVAVKYVKGNLDLVFAILKFEGLESEDHYYVQQTNPGLNIGYPGEFGDNSMKGKVYSGDDISDGLAFIVPDGKNTITFEIAPCEENAAELPKGAATITIQADVALKDSEAPADTAPVVEAETKAETSDGVTTVKAEVKENAVTEEKVAAAASAEGGTLTVEATLPNTDATKAEVTLSKDAVSAIAANDKVTVSVETNVGTVALPAEAVKKVGNDKAAVLTVEKVTTPTVTGAVAEFQVAVKDVTITGLSKPITLSFFVGEGLDTNPTLVYVDNGTLKPILSSVYDPETGIITGTTDHLSTYAAVPTVNGKVTSGGIGKNIELTATKDHFLTVQVTKDGANAIYTVKVPEGGKVSISVPTGCTVTVWETETAPTYTGNVLTPGTVIGTWTNTIEK